MPQPHDDDDDDLLPRPRNTIATNLPPARPSIQKAPIPRRFRRRPRNGRARPAPASSPSTPSAADDALFSAVSTLSDAQLALRTLHASWPHDARRALPRTPPLVLHSQLRALVADPALLDRDLRAAVAQREWRELALPGGDVAYVRACDVRRLALAGPAADNPVFTAFANTLLPATCENAVTSARLADCFPHPAEAEAVLVRDGWLTMRDARSFWFAVPSLGKFRTQREAGNKEILAALRRAPYHEMLLGKLEARSMKKSCFTAQWHVRDLVGGAIAETVETSVGTLVRMRNGD